MEARRNAIARLASSLCGSTGRGQQGYVLILAMLILVALGMSAATLLTAALVNQQHVSRDRTYTQSLAVAEAGLNQYLWMVASGASSRSNNFGIAGNTGPDPHFEQLNLNDIYDDSVQGTYAIQVTPPSARDSNIEVTVTGQATSNVDVPRTVTATLGRPSFSQYLLLTNDEVWIGGPLNRVWHGKTFSNTGICVDTANLNDTMSCSNASYTSSMFGGTHPGVWSGYQYTVPANDPSRALWQFPAPAISFATVTSDFVNLNSLAVGNGINLPYSTSSAHDATQGWYIKLLPGQAVPDQAGHGRDRDHQRQRRQPDHGDSQRARTERRAQLSGQRGHLRERQRLGGRHQPRRPHHHRQLGATERLRQELRHVHPCRGELDVLAPGRHGRGRAHRAEQRRDTAVRAVGRERQRVSNRTWRSTPPSSPSRGRNPATLPTRAAATTGPSATCSPSTAPSARVTARTGARSATATRWAVS